MVSLLIVLMLKSTAVSPFATLLGIAANPIGSGVLVGSGVGGTEVGEGMAVGGNVAVGDCVVADESIRGVLAVAEGATVGGNVGVGETAVSVLQAESNKTIIPRITHRFMFTTLLPLPIQATDESRLLKVDYHCGK